ncbi:MAG: DUF1214 domain-containing protein [Alphaproteobacteria bacterium]|nr:DUF1214 domain-containing protein [Alphaproteobacteria bacterium]MBL7097847.1 DUF1214 domain-containing protein [Alphaproteobacteria bacterium]
MRTFLKILGVLVIGVVLGLAATWATVIRGGWGGAVSDGPWKTSLTVGSSEGGMYQRASVAVHGLLALNRSETIYYTANTDSAGEPLRADAHCPYRIDGRDLPARWWSITAYGADDYLIPNAAGRYSVTKNSVIQRNRDSFVANVSVDPSPENWIPVTKGPFSLSIRLYNPDPKVAADPAHIALPTITSSCGT